MAKIKFYLISFHEMVGQNTKKSFLHWLANHYQLETVAYIKKASEKCTRNGFLAKNNGRRKQKQ